jgi:hypothetical protein
MRSKKTDKHRLLEGRGRGYGIHYKPFVLPSEFSDRGRCHRLLGWKSGRVHYLFSDGELYPFLILQMQDNVSDIREQYPLLPLSETLSIAKRFNISHPPAKKKLENKTIITSDLNIIVSQNAEKKHIVRTVKTLEDYENERTKEKLFIEKKYWEARGIDWGILLHNERSKVIGRNIYFIYQQYFWNEEFGFSTDELSCLIYELKNRIVKYNWDIMNAVLDFDRYMGWEEGQSLNFFKYLLCKKIIKADFSKKFNFCEMNISF